MIKLTCQDGKNLNLGCCVTFGTSGIILFRDV
jgi:hypothetical protein